MNRILKAKEYRSENRQAVVKKAGKKRAIVYPESDGKPMADNTKQFEWIVKIKENLEIVFENDPNVFVAGDFLWYPVEGDNKTRIAPDAMVVFGRPKGHRGSYLMWKEDNIAPQVVFEVLSPGNTKKEMEKKLSFYDKYDVEEYYIYDPDKIVLTGWIRTKPISLKKKGELKQIENMNGWISPRLNIRFELTETDLHIFGPDGMEFLTPLESNRKYRMDIQTEQQRTEKERREKEAERQRAEKESKRAEKERQRAEKLAARLRELGIETDL